MTRLASVSKHHPQSALRSSDVFAISDIGQYWPFKTPAPSREAVKKWIYHGLKGTKLRSALIAGRRCTTVEWIFDFFEAIQDREVA